MNQYKKLVSNTVILGIGSFSSKLLVFLLLPITTNLMTKAEYGTADIVIQAANLLYPVVSIGIGNAILRFGLDSEKDKADVLSTGVLASFAGFLLFLAAIPIFLHIDHISQNIVLLYLYVFFATLHAIFSNFIRANQQIKLFALDGIFCTVLVVLFTVLFLVVFRLGLTGYILATVASNAISILVLFFAARLYRYIKIKGIHLQTSRQMLKYSMPLIPSMVFWWITSVSDRFLITYMISDSANGLYAAANKVPQIIVLLSNIFSDAWMISAVSQDEEGRDNFFSNVYSSYQAIIFLAAAALILCAQPITRLLFADSFFDSWRYIPLLALATVFSCLVTFLQSIYFVEKKSMTVLVTISLGAVINIGLNLILIPSFGPFGAAFSTFVCYLAVFILRALDSRRHIQADFKYGVLLFNLALLSAESYLITSATEYSIYISALILLLLAFINRKPLLLSIKKLIPNR